MTNDKTPQTQPTVGDVVQFLDPALVSVEEQNIVRSLIGSLPVTDAVQMPAHQLAAQITNAQAEVSDLLKKSPLAPHRAFMIASAIIAQFGSSTPSATQQTTSAQPMVVRLEQPVSYEDMDLRELLDALTAKPTALNRILPHIQAQIPQAISLTRGLWVVPLAVRHDGVNIDVAATVDYATKCNRNYARAASRVPTSNGVMRPISLDEALGAVTRPLKHPKTGDPIIGTDEEGYDISSLDSAFLEVITWARETGHRRYPANLDYDSFMEEIFSKTRSRRWTIITGDYEVAKTHSDVQDGLRFYRASSVPQQRQRNTDEGATYGGHHLDFRGSTFGSGSAVIGKQATYGDSHPTTRGPVVPDYEQLVRSAAQARLSQVGSSNDFNGGVFRKIDVSGSSNDFNGVIILEGGIINGSSNDGNLLLPPGGARVTVTGSSNDINQSYISWREIAELLRLV